MIINRRQFLQVTGSAVTGLGLSQVNSFGKVLAKSTPRKLAFLVGINEYPEDGALQGCVNDTLLMRHLLIYRFGFQPKDILTLTDKKATRAGILQGFEEHLIKQAKPDDVVVFLFSGHGSQVYDPNPTYIEPGEEAGLNGTFVPVDSGLPADYAQRGGIVQDIMGHTLFLLMSACKSENFTAVLDSCFSGAATRKYRVKAREGGRKIQISPSEKEYQLTRGFMYAGAKRVVVSLWSVNDAATANLMEKFYQQMLQKGLTPAAALRAAQLEMWKTPATKAPYYWAAFTLQGEWQ